MNLPKGAFKIHPESVKSYLSKISTGNWGFVAGTKTLAELMAEIEKGESFLANAGKLGVVRIVSAVQVTVCYRNLILLELYRKKNGKFSYRPLCASLSEKINPGEKPKEAVFRSIREELGVSAEGNLASLASSRRKTEVNDSGSFPGLKTIYYFYPFKVRFRSRIYKAKGYITDEKGRITRFIWSTRESGESVFKENSLESV